MRRPMQRGESSPVTAGCRATKSSHRFGRRMSRRFCRASSSDISASSRCRKRPRASRALTSFHSGASWIPHLPTGRSSYLCDDVLLRSRSGIRVPLTPDDVEVAAERGAVLRRYRNLDTGCSVSPGGPTSQAGRSRRAAWPRSCAGCASASASTSKSSTVRIRPAHRPAGAENRCPASASCSLSGIASVQRCAST